MTEEHTCFDILVEKTGSNATFEKVAQFNFKEGTTDMTWVINLYHYTPSLLISTVRGKLIPSYCPMCGVKLESD